tara:strand:+ start:1723 stop:2355 length:633 start_codon:yes stop_codon:yes gene_type:complete
MPTNFEILPIFPSVISANKVSEDLSVLWKTVDSLEFFSSNVDDTYLLYTSSNMKILDSVQDIKEILLNYFYEFKDTVLNLSTTDFDITTSWITKTEPGGFCQYHCHRNSYYSGVLYQDKTNSLGSGELLFTDVGIKNETILINDPTEWNLLNSRRIIIEPEENLLVFFPSTLRHRISKYTGTDTRYSLAFNLFPIGKLGSGDSTLNMRIE